MDVYITNIEFAVKMVTALYAQGLVNDATYQKVIEKYANTNAA